MKAKHRRDAKLIEEYLKLMDQANDDRSRHQTTDNALQTTTELLNRNPENYTVWNMRREIMTTMFERIQPEVKKSLLVNDLVFLGRLLKKFPKTYWLWNHRVWCLEQDSTADWDQEMMLVNYMLEKDARNFQCWHYRRYVVKMLERSSSKPVVDFEFDYTTSKINANFSNYSAWHNRSTLIPEYVKEFSVDKRKEFLGSEIAYVTQAIYTDPDDQSAWLYHSWLVEMPQSIVPGITASEVRELLSNEIESLSMLYEEEPDSKNVMFFLARCLHLARTAGCAINDQPITPASLLEKLKTVDPQRINMYVYFSKQMV